MLTVNDLRLPRNWEIIAGADTGTYMGGVICAIDPKYDLYVLEEFPNYHYTGDGTIEGTGETVGEWIKRFATRLKHWTKQRKVHAWVDANTTFKTEIAHGLKFRMNRKDLELRTEITREYLRHGRIHLMPWLTVVPYEMEEAAFPAEESKSGKYKRIKRKDHCLDGLEHCASRRPHPDFRLEKPNQKRSTLRQFAAQHQRLMTPQSDPYLGVN